MSATKKIYPSAGGTYVREADGSLATNTDGSLKQLEETTEPNPGKTARLAEAKAKRKSESKPAPIAPSKENSNG